MAKNHQGQHLKMLAKKYGTQVKLCEDADITRPALNKMYKRKHLSATEKLNDVLKVLGLTYETFIDSMNSEQLTNNNQIVNRMYTQDSYHYVQALEASLDKLEMMIRDKDRIIMMLEEKIYGEKSEKSQSKQSL